MAATEVRCARPNEPLSEADRLACELAAQLVDEVALIVGRGDDRATRATSQLLATLLQTLRNANACHDEPSTAMVGPHLVESPSGPGGVLVRCARCGWKLRGQVEAENIRELVWRLRGAFAAHTCDGGAPAISGSAPILVEGSR